MHKLENKNLWKYQTLTSEKTKNLDFWLNGTGEKSNISSVK